MVYLLTPHSSALQTSTTKFREDFIGPLFLDTTLDKTHHRLKDAAGLLFGQHVPCEPYQERSSTHTSGHSEHI